MRVGGEAGRVVMVGGVEVETGREGGEEEGMEGRAL